MEAIVYPDGEEVSYGYDYGGNVVSVKGTNRVVDCMYVEEIGKVRLLFLPPYSPEYNPTEKTWANMKCFLEANLMFLRRYYCISQEICSFGRGFGEYIFHQR